MRFRQKRRESCESQLNHVLIGGDGSNSMVLIGAILESESHDDAAALSGKLIWAVKCFMFQAKKAPIRSK